MTFDFEEVSPGCLVLTCCGEISWEERDTLGPAVEEHLSSGSPGTGVVLDLKKVTFINSAGLGALFQLVQRLRGQGRNLAITNPVPSVARLFHAVAFDRIAIVAETVSQAISELEKAGAPQTADSQNSTSTSE